MTMPDALIPAEREDAPAERRATTARQRLGTSLRWARANLGITIGATILLMIVILALFAPLPHDPFRPDASNGLQAPSSLHWMGTDSAGFDVFSRTVAAGRLDLPLALIATFISLAIGVPIGLAASTKSRTSEYVMRALDVFQAFPLLVLAIVLVAITGNNLRNVVVAIVLINAPRFVRLTRSEALSVRESRFIEAAQAMGAGPQRIVWRHLLPNISGSILAQASLSAANSIVVIAALSFIGIGTSPSDASWGSMIRAGSQSMATGQWWIALGPGLAVFLTVVSFNAVADGMMSRLEER